MSKKIDIPFSTTIHVKDHCLCLHAQRTARALARRFDEVLRPAGLTNGQFSLLMSLNRPEPPNMSSVASLLAMDRTTLTAALKPLEREGLVKESPDPNDKRTRRLVLTDAGRKKLSVALPIWTKAHDEIEKSLASADPDRLRADLLSLS